jgi:plasmid stabilization system protein ParE
VVAYINESSPQNARRVLTAVLSAGASLSTLAERGRVVPEVADLSKRELIVLGYRLMYHVTETTVTILAVVRGRRDFTPGADN